MDALHLIRAAAEFADALERDAQTASAVQFRKAEEDLRHREREIADKEVELEKFRQESERQRAELVNAARSESREVIANAQRDAATELREAEAKGARLLEQSRHQATELTNATRAEVEQTLDWARNQANAIIARAQQGAEQLLSAAGLGPDAVAEVSQKLVEAVRLATTPQPPAPAATIAAVEPTAEAETVESSDDAGDDTPSA